MKLRIKICGITNLEDALAAVEAGADALGFVFYPPSPRYVNGATVAQIIRELPPFVAKVGVFVNAGLEEIRTAIERCGLDTLQFHGDESPEFCRQFSLKTIKAFRLKDEGALKQMEAYGREAWLLDSYVAGKLGGTGVTPDWELARRAARLNSSVILAGGLTRENVAEAVRCVRPFGVDVSSGVEAAPEKKDAAKVRAFIAAARSAESMVR